MSASFRDYEADYQSQLDSIRKDINTLTHSLMQQNRSATKIYNRTDLVKRLLEQHSHMKGSLAHMELESNEGTPEQIQQSKKKLAEMKKEAFSLEREITRLKVDAMAADRSDLVNRTSGGRTGEYKNDKNNATDDQLTKMTQNTQTMHKSSATLTKALQYVVRMNEHGEATLVELRRQDETIDRVMMTGAETDTELTTTARILRDMKALAMKNNIMLAGVVIVLVMMIVGLLYYEYGRPLARYFDDNNDNSNNNDAPASPSPGSVIGAPSVAPAPQASSNLNSAFALDGFKAAPSNGGIYSLQNFIPGN